ncbi:hypothetical protein AAE478_003542 [Parahypoxylon ruwenzoriense]
MLSRQLLRRLPRLAVVTRHLYPSPRPRPRFSSTKTQQGESSSTKGALVPFAAGLSTASLAAYLVGGSREKEAPSSQSSNDLATQNAPASKRIPDLNELGLSDQIPYSPPASSEDVTRQLNERAFSLSGENGVTRYDGAQVASNDPCEDAFIHGSFSTPFAQRDWMAWAVFDGHCGWQLSNLLTKQLIPYVRRAFGDVESKAGQEVNEDAIQQALKSAFTKLDDALVKSAVATIESDLPFAEKARRLEAAYAGSCALLTLFDPSSRTLRVASTGDCRAVLGQKTADGKWVTTELSTDQTGATPSEITRLRAQFPDEPDVVQGGRVWGMQPSRTFGDGMWKWTSQLKENLRNHYNGLSLPSAVRYQGYKDGPYLTAEPMVTTTNIPDSQPSFVILATDGLWDTMESAEAVDLVGRWIDWQAQSRGPLKPETSDFGPTILGRKQQCKYEDRKATLQDGNVAVHLVRNSLGGADEETVKGALTFRYPNSRDIRDDITVQVVFFSPAQGK